MSTLITPGSGATARGATLQTRGSAAGWAAAGGSPTPWSASTPAAVSGACTPPVTRSAHGNALVREDHRPRRPCTAVICGWAWQERCSGGASVQRCNPCSALLIAPRCVTLMSGWLLQAGFTRECLQARAHPLAASARCGSHALCFVSRKELAVLQPLCTWTGFPGACLPTIVR